MTEYIFNLFLTFSGRNWQINTWHLQQNRSWSFAIFTLVQTFEQIMRKMANDRTLERNRQEKSDHYRAPIFGYVAMSSSIYTMV